MQAKKTNALRKRLHLNMAPLATKIGDTFHKLNDKLKRHRVLDESESSSQAKQPRTLPEQSLGPLPAPASPSSLPASQSGPQSSLVWGLPSHAQPSPGSSLPLATCELGQSPRSAMADHAGGGIAKQSGSAGQPIDLTDTPDSPGFSSSHPIDLVTPSPPAASSHTTPSLRAAKEQDSVMGHSKSKQSAVDQDDKTTESGQPNATPTSSDDSVFILRGRWEARGRSPPSTLREYGQELLARKCPRCLEDLRLDEATVVSTTKSKIDKGLLHSYFPCRNCKRLVGPGCNCHARGALERGVPNLPVRLASEKDLNVSWCCDSGRLFLIWSLLCGTQYEKPSVRANLKPSSSEGKVQPEDKDTAKNAKSPETKSSKLSKGTGYAGDKKEITFKAAAKIRKELASENMYLQKYFAALSVIYPSIQVNRKRPTAFDRRPPDMITECVERSPLLRKACEVLRNESVQEIGAQTGLYTAVLEFVECLGAHVSGRPLVYGEHHLFSLPEQLLHFTLTPAPNTTSKASEQAEMSQSLHASLCQLAQNCRSFLQIASGHRDVFEDGADRQLLALCKDIIVLFEAQAQARADMQARCPPKASMDRATEDYKEWHSNNCLNDVPDDKVIQSFHTDLRVEAEKLLNSKPASGRMKRIITQISDLRTGLPEGIYVRHGTSRPDVIKVLMVGTRDTPYENGLFEFDMLCDEHFPTRPPAMRFRTTGGGVVRFNPNLYQNGTVCLSLLNTWGGQRWVQDYTTMLTLLVSIHGMVFNDEPYYNEPGYEQQINKAASEAYNKSTQELTVQHALLHWLLDRLCPPFKTPSAAAKTQATPPQSATFQTVPASFTHPPHTASHPQAQSQYASAKNENKQPAAPAPFLPAPQPFTPSSYPSFHQTFNPVQPHAHIVGSHGLQLAGYLPTAYAFHPHMGPHPSHPGSHLAPVFAPGSGGAPPFGPHNMPVPVAVHNTVPQPGQIGYPVSYAFPMGSPSWVVNQQALGGQQPPYPPPPPAALPQQTVEQGRRPVTDPRDGDDGVWGDVIRKHFATRGRDILATARKWEKTWSANKNTKTDPKAPTLVDSLETALRLHGFIH